MDDDKRRTSRIQVNYPVTMQTPEETTKGEVKNLSSGGAYIDCEKPLAPGEIFDMSIILKVVHIHALIHARETIPVLALHLAVRTKIHLSQS